MSSVERKLALVDLRDARKRVSGKACPTCGAGAATAAEEATTEQGYVARAQAELASFERDGWALDLAHADTARFKAVVDLREQALDLVFAVALQRAVA